MDAAPEWSKGSTRQPVARGKPSCSALTLTVPSPCHCPCRRLCEALARLHIPQGHCGHLSPAPLAQLQCLCSAPLTCKESCPVMHPPTAPSPDPTPFNLCPQTFFSSSFPDPDYHHVASLLLCPHLFPDKILWGFFY